LDSVQVEVIEAVYGCRHSLPDGIRRAIGVMFDGRQALIGGYEVVSKGCVFAMHTAGVGILITVRDPICVLQACILSISSC
jgi:adenosylhomocysteinase